MCRGAPSCSYSLLSSRLADALACSLHLPWHHASNHHTTTHTLHIHVFPHTPNTPFHARAPVARSRCTASRLERSAPFLQRLQSQVSSSGSCQRPAQLRWNAALQASQQRRSPVCVVVVLVVAVRWWWCFVWWRDTRRACTYDTRGGFSHITDTQTAYRPTAAAAVVADVLVQVRQQPGRLGGAHEDDHILHRGAAGLRPPRHARLAEEGLWGL